MPGGTQKYGLPYLLNTEGLWTIGNVTKLLAERLEALIDNGTLKGAPGSPGAPGAPGGPNGPAASIVLNTAYSAASGSIFFAFNNSGTVEYDLRTAGGAQTFNNGLIASRAGIYQISIVVPWGTNNATGQRVIKLVDDASGEAYAEDVRPGVNMEQINQLSVTMPLTAGQKLNCYVYQNSGSALNVGGTQQGRIKTRFAMTYLGPST